MAKLTLVYGMRLLPSEEIEEVGEAQVKLKNGRDARVTQIGVRHIGTRQIGAAQVGGR